MKKYKSAVPSEDVAKKEKQLLNLYPDIDSSFLEWLLFSGFYTAPASINHHGNSEGGLFYHSMEVAFQLKNLTENNNLFWEDSRSPVLIGLFHDICKVDQYRYQAIETLHVSSPTSIQEMEVPGKFELEYNNNTLLKGHGEKSVMILASHIQLTEEEVLCIRYHMGAFSDKNEWTDYTRAIQTYPNVLWTHHADMIASQITGV